MLVSLYSTRLLLSSLGELDYGVYNVVGGAIAMLGFLNSTMANATQRFMSFAEGEGSLGEKRKIFNVSVTLHFFIALLTVLLLLVAMVPLFRGVFNINPDRIRAAKVVYYCLIFSSFLTIINVPYDAVMNAHENMLYYSIIGILESLLKLGIAFICVYTSRDKLIIYGFLMACIPLVTLSIMKMYCHKHYDECVIAPRRYWDGSLVKRVSSFFGWNFLTAISSLFSAQGIGIVLNHFFGAALNAAQAIANQVNGVLSSFSMNMMKALNPVIVKSAGAKNIAVMNRATLAGCKFSTLLTLLFAIPLSLEIHYVLNLWLEEVPQWTMLFCVMQLSLSIITQMANSASTAVYAQGNIKHYAIWKSITNALPVVLTWIAFSLGGGPVWLYIPMIVIWGLGGDAVIIHYAKKNCSLNVTSYMKDVALPIGGVIVLSILCGWLVISLIPESFFRLILTSFVTTMVILVSVYSFFTTKEEKAQVLDAIRHR